MPDKNVFIWDHPRLCGEKLPTLKPEKSRLGSPPPMRGKVVVFISLPVYKRITPAYAGKSVHVIFCTFLHWDHPRLCGEKSPTATTGKYQAGSPPPMRGKVHLLKYPHNNYGITPAYAGKSNKKRYTSWIAQDHPRLCGEKGYFAGYYTSASGITPAYAGKSRNQL